MLQQFIDQTKGFLKRSDITIHELHIQEIEIEKNGGLSVYLKAVANINSVPKISENFLLHTMLFFALADAKLDLLEPTLEGESFRGRYKKLYPANDNQIIFKEYYRILKIIRNSATHSRNSILINSNILTVNYIFNGTNYNLKISKLGLELIYTFILDACVPANYPKCYKEAVARSLHDDICNEISALNDEFGNSLVKISNGLRLGRRRLRVKNTLFEENRGLLKIRTNVKADFNPNNLPLEYLVDYNGLKLVLSEEILNPEKSISIKEILKWSYDNHLSNISF